MNNLNAKISSKGQITIPRSVREALDVDFGDTIQFHVRDDLVIISKSKLPDMVFQTKVFNTLVKECKGDEIMILKGQMGHGKTVLLNKWLRWLSHEFERALVIEHHREIESSLTGKSTIEFTTIDDYTKHMDQNYEIIIVDQYKDPQFLKKLKEHNPNTKIVASTQEFGSPEIELLKPLTLTTIRNFNIIDSQKYL